MIDRIKNAARLQPVAVALAGGALFSAVLSSVQLAALFAAGAGLAWLFAAASSAVTAGDFPPGGAARSLPPARPEPPPPDARGRALVVVQTLSVAVADERELSRLAAAERLRGDAARAVAARAFLAGDRGTVRAQLARKLEADRIRARLERELEAQRAEVARLEPELERAASEVRLERAAEIRLTRAEARRVTVLHASGLAGEGYASGERERRSDRLEAEAEVLERAFSPGGEERWDEAALDEEERKLREDFGPGPAAVPA